MSQPRKYTATAKAVPDISRNKISAGHFDATNSASAQVRIGAEKKMN